MIQHMNARPMMPQHHPFVKTIAQALRHRCGVTTGEHLLVAVSGGADSIALLRAMAVLAPRRHWELTLAVAHVQHHLRDEAGDAEADARFTQELTRTLGLPFLRADLDAAELLRRGNMEANARRARYAALVRMARDHGCTGIVTAHHGDDQLETLLMRLMRGSAVRGLSGMAWRRAIRVAGHDQPIHLLRPMLHHSRADVVRFLRDLNQDWREDHTNLDVTRRRARLRRDVLPVLHELCPHVARRATQTADHLREVVTLLDTLADQHSRELVERHEGIWRINRPAARKLPTIALIELLRRLALEAGARADHLGASVFRPIVDAIADTQGGTRRFTLSGGVEVTLTRAEVTITKRAEC